MSSNSTDNVTFFETSFYLGNGLLGTFFNSIVLLIAIRHVDTDDKPRQIIVMNMSAADLIFCITYVITRPWTSSFPLELCRPYYVMFWTAQMCSCMMLLWLNVDKLLYIQFPLHYYSMVTRSRTMMLCVVTWIVLLAYAIAANYTMQIGMSCVQTSFDPNFIYMTMVAYYVLVIYSSFAISAIIFFIAQTTTSMEQRARKRLFQRLFFLFSSTLWTFITCIPFRALYLVTRICPTCLEGNLIVGIAHFTFLFLVVGSVVNPVITIVTQRIYRSRLVSYLTKWQEIVSNNSEETYVPSTRRQSSKGAVKFETAPRTTSL